MKSLSVGCSALLVVAFLAGCGPAKPDSSASITGGSVERFTDLVREVHYDYEPPISPSALAEMVDLVVVGRITAVASGRTIAAIGSHATLEVTVDRVLRGSSADLTDGKVYVEVITTPKATVEAYRDFAPGTRIAFFLLDRSKIPGDGATGAPAGAKIFAPRPPGLVLEFGVRLTVAYEDLGAMPEAWRVPADFDAFIASLE